MGGRAGSGARGRRGYSLGEVSGYKTAPFKGAARVGDLKAGDKIKLQNGMVSDILKVEKVGKGQVFITSKIGDQSFGNLSTPGRYLNGTKL